MRWVCHAVGLSLRERINVLSLRGFDDCVWYVTERVCLYRDFCEEGVSKFFGIPGMIFSLGILV